MKINPQAFFLKSVTEVQDSLQCDKNNGHLT
jgi:hypothetical protein